jgi:Protein of unknown function (DUF3300)
MRKQWRMIWCLMGMASLCWVGGRAMGQVDSEAPQYPQYVQYPEGAPPVTPGVPGAQVVLTPDQIDQLLGPIALYPDPLLSLIFPAATYPQDVVAAEQWLVATPNPTEADIAAQSWDDSIKGLVHYPTVLKMMSDQIDWTQAVGAAFLNQQQDALDSIQRLRAQAQADRSLQTTQQEQVLDDDGSIRIEPVDPDVMYVPQYDPNLVYTSAYPVSFGVGLPIGLWCDNDFDWNRHYIVSGGGWYGGWHHPAAWDQHPPAWNRHPAGWAAAPKPWARPPQRPAPELTTAAVAHLGLDRSRGATAANSAPGAARRYPAPLPIGRQAAPEPSRSAFDSSQSRDEVQRAVQRVRPTLAQPSAAAREAPARVAPTPDAPRFEAPAAQRSAPGNAFDGGSAGDARAQSARGHASGHR